MDTQQPAAEQPARKKAPPSRQKYLAKRAKHATIRGGYMVARRGRAQGALRAHPFPIEHGTLEEALTEAERLATLHGREFVVFAAVFAAGPPSPAAPNDAAA